MATKVGRTMARTKGRRAPQRQVRKQAEPVASTPVQRSAVAPWRPRGYDALGEKGWAAGARLQEATAALRGLEQQRAEEVARLRALGASWAVVGWLVGTSGEAARKRWGT